MDNVFSFLKESAANYPDKIFLSDRDKTLTFARAYEKNLCVSRAF